MEKQNVHIRSLVEEYSKCKESGNEDEKGDVKLEAEKK